MFQAVTHGAQYHVITVCLAATIWPLTTYKVYQTPLICIERMWYDYQEGGGPQSYHTMAMPTVSPTVSCGVTTTDTKNTVVLHHYECQPQ